MTNVDACKALIDSLATKGLNKYGVPLEQPNATVSRLARHGAEEMADALAYFVELERRAADLEEENEKLRALKTPPVQCYWDGNDRECGHSDPSEILDNYGFGAVAEIEHVAVVKITYEARLPAADDADSDDDWEVMADTLEEAEAAVEAERARRLALIADPNPVRCGGCGWDGDAAELGPEGECPACNDHGAAVSPVDDDA